MTDKAEVDTLPAVTIGAGADDARVGALTELHDQLFAAVTLSERLEEFLLAAQIALALDTVRVALVGAGVTLEAPRQVGVRAG